MKKSERLVREWQRDCQPMADPVDLEELEKRIDAALPSRAVIEAAVKQAIAHFSSPAVGRGDIHDGQTGYIIYERDGLPFVIGAVTKAIIG